MLYKIGAQNQDGCPNPIWLPKFTKFVIFVTNLAEKETMVHYFVPNTFVKSIQYPSGKDILQGHQLMKYLLSMHVIGKKEF